MKNQLLFSLLFLGVFGGLEIHAGGGQAKQTKTEPEGQGDISVKLKKVESESKVSFLGRTDIPNEIKQSLLQYIVGPSDFWSQSKELSKFSRLSKDDLAYFKNYLFDLANSSGKTPNQLFLEGFKEGRLSGLGFEVLKQIEGFDAKKALEPLGTIDQLFTEELAKGFINSIKIKVLIALGANLNKKNSYGMTPLMVAVKNRNKDMIELLLKGGADPNKKDSSEGNSPLSWIIKKDWYSMFPVSSSDQKDYQDMAKLLVAEGADLNKQLYIGETLLGYAIKRNYKDLIKLILEKGGNPNIKDDHFNTPLKLAMRFNNLHDNKDIIKLLLEKGGDPNVQDSYGRSLLKWAKEKDYKDIVELLIYQKTMRKE